MIKLTRPDGSNVWVKADAIIRVEPAEGNANALVLLGDQVMNRVKEYPEDIIKLTLAAK